MILTSGSKHLESQLLAKRCLSVCMGEGGRIWCCDYTPVGMLTFCVEMSGFKFQLRCCVQLPAHVHHGKVTNDGLDTQIPDMEDSD